MSVEQIHRGRWAQGEHGEWNLRVKDPDGRPVHAWITERPGYCDRGHYLVNIDGIPSLDSADFFPRYFLSLSTAMDETELFLRWRLYKEPATPLDTHVARIERSLTGTHYEVLCGLDSLIEELEELRDIQNIRALDEEGDRWCGKCRMPCSLDIETDTEITEHFGAPNYRTTYEIYSACCRADVLDGPMGENVDASDLDWGELHE